MSQHIVRIRSIKDVTHDTISIATDKPDNYNFKPGQATWIALDRDGWRNKKRPFTFTSLPEDDHIEFIIKTYPEHDGTTDKLLDVREGETLILFDIFGTIVYRGEGVFIAGGAGITPFISILRDLHKKGETGNNKLIFANKTKKDIMLRNDFEHMLGDNFLNILSEEKTDEFAYGFVTADFLKEHVEDFSKYFYICGPPVMIRKLEQYLAALNVDKKLIIKEVF
jgi:ferredoxin-NADP reductase